MATPTAFQEHGTIHLYGSVFECRKCNFTCPKLYLMIGHNVVHAKERQAVLEEENKLVNKPWFIPKESNKQRFIPKGSNNAEGEIQQVADNINNKNEIQQDLNLDDTTYATKESDLELFSYGNEDIKNEFTSDSYLETDVYESKVIDNEDKFTLSKQYFKYEDTGNKNSERAGTKFTCSICGIIFQDISLFEDHVRMHTLTNLQSSLSSSMCVFRFACESCEFKCEDIQEFDIHKKSHYKPGLNTCQMCRRNFKTKLQLRTHNSKVHIKIFMCEMCPFQTKYDHNLNRHKRLVHSTTKVSYSTKHKDVDVTKKSNETSFECEICSKKFKSEERLKYHELFHSKQNDVAKDFECLLCEKTFLNKRSFLSHNVFHSKEKPFHCGICSFKTKWESNLRFHMKKQHNENKIRLEEKTINSINSKDSKTSQINHSITDNIEYVRTERFFNCEFCEYKSKFSGNLNKHTKKYHKDRYSEHSKGKRLKLVLYKKAKESTRENIKTKKLKTKIVKEKSREIIKTNFFKTKMLGSNQPQRKGFATLHTCKFCFYKSIYKSSLTKHMLNFHSKGSFESSQDLRKNNIKKVISHEKKKNTSKNKSNKDSESCRQYNCSYCEYSSKWNSTDVRKHMKNIHGKNGIVIVRSKKDTNKKAKKKSKKIDKNGIVEHINQFRCNYCDYISKRSSNDVHNHMINIHGKDGDIIISKVKKKNICIKTVKKASGKTKKENLTKINNDNIKEKKSESKLKTVFQKVHRCSICSYTNYRKDHLLDHIKSHNQGTGPVIFYKCPECLHCCVRKTSLVSHLKSHVGTKAIDKTRICPGCKKTLNSDRTRSFEHIEKCLT